MINLPSLRHAYTSSKRSTISTLTSAVFLALYLLLATGPAQAQKSKIGPIRVEPAEWWVGMKNPKLQLMFHGDEVGLIKVEWDHPGVKVTGTEITTNHNYKFVNVELSPDAVVGESTIVLKRGRKTVAKIPFKLHEREPGSAERKGFSSKDVMYLITPDRFANGDPSNDAHPSMKEGPDRANLGGRHGGDIRGIINNLDYIERMGFTAIWSNPVVENNQEKYSYHGYSTTDFYGIDPRMGTLDDYIELSKKAKQKGIGLIMDMIMNHIGTGHWWVADPPSPEWVNNNWEYKVTNHWRSTIHDPYSADSDSTLFVEGWFDKSMPDLNQRHPLLATYLIQNSIWWVEKTGLSGIRMDTYPYPDMDFMSEWSCRIMEEYPNFSLVGEEWSLKPSFIAYWQEGNNRGYRSCMPSMMDFPVQDALAKALTEKESWSDGWIKLYEVLGSDFLYPDPANLVIFLENHDMDRYYRQVNQDLDLFKMGTIYLLTMRGIPQYYYGTEILLTNEKAGDHGDIRIDFPGGWPGDEVNGFKGKGLTADQKEAQDFTAKLLNWRKSADLIHNGDLKHYGPMEGIYVYFRYDKNRSIMVILNKNKESKPVILDRFAESLEGYTKAKDVLTGKGYGLDGPILLEPMQSVVLELSK